MYFLFNNLKIKALCKALMEGNKVLALNLLKRNYTVSGILNNHTKHHVFVNVGSVGYSFLFMPIYRTSTDYSRDRSSVRLNQRCDKSPNDHLKNYE